MDPMYLSSIRTLKKKDPVPGVRAVRHEQEKAPTRAFSLLKEPTSALIFDLHSPTPKSSASSTSSVWAALSISVISSSRLSINLSLEQVNLQWKALWTIELTSSRS